MPQSKATKKFEQRHLKDKLSRSNDLRKVKQRQQVKAKKRARRAEDLGDASIAAPADEVAMKKKKKDDDADAYKNMSVDEFFQGGFDMGAFPDQNGSKRKRNAEDDQDGDGSDSESDDALEENEALLQEMGALEELGKLSDDEDEDEDNKRDLTLATVKKWKQNLVEQHSIRTAKEVVMAFRSASQEQDDENAAQFKYTVSHADVYHLLLTTALTNIPEVFQHHLPVQESKAGKAHVATESKKFQTLSPILKSQTTSILRLLESLTDEATLRLTLSAILPLLPYLLSFKKIVRDVVKVIATIFASPTSTASVRIAAFLVLRRLMVIADAGIREGLLKSVYQGLIKGSRNTTVHTVAGINLMKNSAAELWRIDASVGYTTAFTFIRQLAIHLRTSIQDKSKDAHRQVYNWQYVHSLDFWSRVLSAHCTEPDAPLNPLIYPLVQVTLGALRLIPTATYFPLRFHLVRALLRISRSTGTYIPLAPALYEVLASAEMRKAPKASTLKPLDFSVNIRAPKSYLHSRTYQDGIGEQVQELLAEFFVLWAKNISFPELALPVMVMLKRWMKDANNRAPGKGNKNQKLNSAIAILVQKLESQSRWIEERRAKVDFAPNNRKGVESFLVDTKWESSPLGAFVVGLRKVREEKAKTAEEARQEDEKRKEKERAEKKTRGGHAAGEVEDDASSSDGEDVENDEDISEGFDDEEDEEATDDSE